MDVVESYLHKMAKELLYNEIQSHNGFRWKTNDKNGCASLIEREDYRGECLLMEFPTKEGSYPDEFGCEVNNEECGYSCMQPTKHGFNLMMEIIGTSDPHDR